jgi:mannose-6-phosphate isomerase
LTAPERLRASFHEKIWGSTNLEPWFPKSKKQIGEVWFTADPPPPVLVKFLFTSDKLSVQVHPAGPQGKTEMWYILRADPGARIALGFREPLSRNRLRDAAHSGEIENLLQWLPVSAGETYFTPAGTVHAIGAGIALCEIQQYSDVTYRLYDYGRPRELHIESALEIAHLGAHPGRSKPQGQLLARCDYFETALVEFAGPEATIETADRDLLIFLEGSGALAAQQFHPGEVWSLPQGAWPLQSAQLPVRALQVTVPPA